MSTPAVPPTIREQDIAGNGTEDANATIEQPQANRGSLSSFIFMTIMLFMLTNGGGDDVLVRSQYRDSLQSLRYQQRNFSAWLDGGGAVNASNYTLPEIDPMFTTLAHSVMAFGVPPNPHLASYYSNITGFVRGTADVHNLSAYTLNASDVSPVAPEQTTFDQSSATLIDRPYWGDIAGALVADLNMSDVSERTGLWNWSTSTNINFRVLENKSSYEANPLLQNSTLVDDISLLHGRIELTDANTEEEIGLDIEAVHFISNGTIYGLAEPLGRHVDIRDLPSLVPAKYMNITAQAVNAELLSRIQRLQDMVDSGVVEIDAPSSGELGKTTCPFTLYAQLVPTSVPLLLMQELEEEMDHPTGITTVERPELKLNALLISKECGIMLEIRSADGLKSQRFWRKVTTYSALAALNYLVLLVLFVRQSESSHSPVGISRVSRWTFLTQSAADSISFVGHITFGVLAEGPPSMSLIAPAFLACVLLVYEARLSVLIHQIQAPEEVVVPPAVPPDAARTESAQRGATSPADGAGTAIQSRGEPSVLARLWRRIRENPQTRFWFSVIVSLALFVRILISPSLALFVTAFIYSNFWVPQIVRSARRGTSSSLRLEYLLGTSMCRLFFALYLFACPKNVLGVDPSPWVYVVVAFVFLQVLVILLQDYIDPRFFLPHGYAPVEKYDYHPLMPVPDAEAPDYSLGDCAICMDAIVVHPEHWRKSFEWGTRRSVELDKAQLHGGRAAGGLEGILGAMQMGIQAAGRTAGATTKAYALAPCQHLFHTACLEKWLAIKNICPQCRRPLPPL